MFVDAAPSREYAPVHALLPGAAYIIHPKRERTDGTGCGESFLLVLVFITYLGRYCYGILFPSLPSPSHIYMCTSLSDQVQPPSPNHSH